MDPGGWTLLQTPAELGLDIQLFFVLQCGTKNSDILSNVRGKNIVIFESGILCLLIVPSCHSEVTLLSIFL